MVGAPTAMPGIIALNPYEIATRMSYLIWGSSPDDDLRADAAAGVLDSAEGRQIISGMRNDVVALVPADDRDFDALRSIMNDLKRAGVEL